MKFKKKDRKKIKGEKQTKKSDQDLSLKRQKPYTLYDNLKVWQYSIPISGN